MRKFWLIFSIIFVTLAIFSNDCGVSAEPLTALEIRTATITAIGSNPQFQGYMSQNHNPLLIHLNTICQERGDVVQFADEMWQYYSRNPAIKDKIRDNQFNSLKTAITGQIQSEPIRGVLITLAKRDNCADVQLSYDLAFIRRQLKVDTEEAYYHPQSKEYNQVLKRPEHRDFVLLFVRCENYFAATTGADKQSRLWEIKKILFKPFLWHEVRTYMWSLAIGPNGEIDEYTVDYYYDFAVSHLQLQYVSLLLYGVEYA